uniref:Uncharacterized protein n=1 Tax=Panagrolaimus superbus TaxID=310955 RepID=A0A914YBC4_9BILA
MITNIAMDYAATEDGSQEHIVRSAERMFFARGRLSDSFDTALLRFNECLQTMNSLNTDPVPQIFPAYGGIDEFVPVIDDDINDPFGIESVSFRAFIFTDANENQDFVNAFEEHDSTQNYPVSDSSDYADDQHYNNNPANDNDQHDYHFNNSDNVDYHNVPTYDEEYDDFRPGVWAPLSQLFSLSRVNHPN